MKNAEVEIEEQNIHVYIYFFCKSGKSESKVNYTGLGIRKVKILSLQSGVLGFALQHDPLPNFCKKSLGSHGHWDFILQPWVFRCARWGESKALRDTHGWRLKKLLPSNLNIVILLESCDYPTALTGRV